MQPQRPVEEAGTGAAGAERLNALMLRLHDLRAGGQAEVVVGAEHDAALSLHDDFRVLFGLQRVE
jgi:hypothetical protein